MVTIFFRTIIVYLLLIGVMRLMGKRQIGELELSELIITLMLSELAVAPISNSNIPLSHAVIPIVTLIALEIILTYIVTKCAFLKAIFDGKPSYIVSKGTVDQKELGKIRMSLDELIGETRQKDIGDISEINYAILESNGQLSVFPKTPDNKGIAHPLIIDGKICEKSLGLSGKSEAWLLGRISALRCNLKDVFLFTVDDCGNENLIKKAGK